MSAPSLSTLQRWMKARIQPGESQPADALAAALNPQGGEPGAARLAVYAEGYCARVREALAEVYEAVRHVLGELAFAQLARAYAQRWRSHDGNLGFVGRELPTFLAASAWQEQLPFLSDLAQLEWRVQEAFHAREQPPLDATPLSLITPEAWGHVRLRFQPSVSLVDSAWPIVSIWEARTRPRGEIDIPLVGHPQCALISRQGFAVRCEVASPAQRMVLSGLLAGQTLGTVCGRLTETADEDPHQVTEWFLTWMRAGLIVGYTGGEQ